MLRYLTRPGGCLAAILCCIGNGGAASAESAVTDGVCPDNAASSRESFKRQSMTEVKTPSSLIDISQSPTTVSTIAVPQDDADSGIVVSSASSTSSVLPEMKKGQTENGRLYQRASSM